MAIKNVFAETTALKKRIKNMSVDELQACMSSVESGETLLVDIPEGVRPGEVLVVTAPSGIELNVRSPSRG